MILVTQLYGSVPAAMYKGLLSLMPLSSLVQYRSLLPCLHISSEQSNPPLHSLTLHAHSPHRLPLLSSGLVNLRGSSLASS